MKNKENCHVLVKHFHRIFVVISFVVEQLNLLSGMKNDALMDREGLKSIIIDSRDVYVVFLYCCVARF